MDTVKSMGITHMEDNEEEGNVSQFLKPRLVLSSEKQIFTYNEMSPKVRCLFCYCLCSLLH
jgi:hypothetical protein